MGSKPDNRADLFGRKQQAEFTCVAARGLTRGKGVKRHCRLLRWFMEECDARATHLLPWSRLIRQPCALCFLVNVMAFEAKTTFTGEIRVQYSDRNHEQNAYARRRVTTA